MSDPKHRFDRHADAYAKGRPGYPRAVGDFVAQLGRVVVEIGAGTGRFTAILRDAGLRVIAIEPSAPMRAHLPDARNGSAEDTGLPDASVDVVAAAQAAHWFDPARAPAEWRRILRPGGSVVLLWNNRDVRDPFTAELDATLIRFARDRGDRGDVVASLLGDARHTVFASPHTVDADGFAAYVRSLSYLAPDDDAAFAALDDVYARHARDGRVTIAHTCDVYDARAS